MNERANATAAESGEASPATAGPTPSHVSTLGREAAQRLLREARRLYDVAALVHERGGALTIDSAPALSKSLRFAARLLLRLHGGEETGQLEELAPRLQEINRAESIVTWDIAEDLTVVGAVARRFSELESSVERADARRYDRAFVRSARLIAALEQHLDVLLPRERRKWLPRLWLAMALPLALGAGVLIGSRWSRSPALPAPTAKAAPVLAQSPTGIVATFYSDPELRDSAFTRTDTQIAFDWAGDAPPGLEQNDHFSVRWAGQLSVPATGRYDFLLSSDDGSRLFIDDKLVIDSWAIHTWETKEASTELEAGLHALRVEYFDGTGDAAIKLEWKSSSFERRVVGGEDLR
jgi:hypothetical protein